MKTLIFPLFVIVFVTSSCTRPSSREVSVPESETIPLEYAHGFKIRKDSIYTWIEIKEPFQGATKGFTYLLVPRGKAVPPHPPGVKVISTPISSVVCTSTTHIPMLDYLEVSDRLVGFPTTDYISSEKTRKLVDEGKVVDLGIDNGLNIEKLAVLKPDLVIGYTMTPEYGQFKKIEELGIPVVINAEYLEKHPLGRAEWIKFVAHFFDKEELADSIFSAIRSDYLASVELVKASTSRPLTLTGIMYGDAWFLAGGKNYAATILKDAGFHYLWEDDSTSGFLELSFEAVYSKALNCDYWIGVGVFRTLNEMTASEVRYGKFKAFREKRVYSYNARTGAKGGNEYLELGYLRPDIILRDLIKISHPDLLTDHELYFHRKLE
jgi:iron complex transport system substrate-binding protein